MDLSRRLVGASISAVGALSPRWGSALALPLFSSVARPRPVHPDDLPTMWMARRSVIRVPGVDRRGVDVAVYEWGRGPRAVVVAHGWNGRASQFATLVRELVAEGYRVIAFDAPAHGASPGRRAYVVDWIDALSRLQERHGVFDAVIGHSFGGLAALIGVAGGVHAERVVTVAAPGDAELLLTQFRLAMHLSEGVSRALGERFARRYFAGDPDPFVWLSAVRRPLAPGTPLLVVHDDGDRTVPFAEAARIASMNAGAISVSTAGFGHNRILAADAFLDAVLEFLASGRVETAAAPLGDIIGGREALPRGLHAQDDVVAA